MSKIKVTLEMDCDTILDFENNLGMDGDWELMNSIIDQLDHGDADDNTCHHNGIKVTIEKDVFDIPYKKEEEPLLKGMRFGEDEAKMLLLAVEYALGDVEQDIGSLEYLPNERGKTIKLLQGLQDKLSKETK